ncbi:MAG TPA: AMP-binding protein, partial [Bacteroidales bacterium]|nr:AMP-binding protein [Bacteroidales bacterium]
MLKENFVEFIEKSIKSNWTIDALADYKGISYTYSDVARKISRLHIAFRLAGIKKGDKIALIGKNSASWGITFIAAVTYGAVIVPILPDFTVDDVHHIINHSDSKILFAGDSFYDVLDMKETPDLSVIFSLTDYNPLYTSDDSNLENIGEETDRLFNEQYGKEFGPDAFSVAKVGNAELAEISYTSGTSGFSKGVMLSHNSLIANIRYAHENMPLEPRDSIVSFLPLAHSYGCAFEFLFPFTLGCHITFLGKTPTPQIIMEAF